MNARVLALFLLVSCDDGPADKPDTSSDDTGVPVDTEDDCTVVTTWHVDADGDGYGNGSGDWIDACIGPEGYVDNGDDCNDTYADINPGGTEVCDDIDNDCDGYIDEGIEGSPTWYEDHDGDGYGDNSTGEAYCDDPPAGLIETGGDCDDGDPTAHRDAVEVCDGVDNDCDGSVDEYLTVELYVDADGDGFGNPDELRDFCLEDGGWAYRGTDCDDDDPTSYPGADELCFDGADNDCDGEVDETGAVDARVICPDSDGDGYGDLSLAEAMCTRPTGYVTVCTDCDDGDADTYPGGYEFCGDGVDGDCDGTVDDGEETSWYFDADSDGYGDDSTAVTLCDAPVRWVDEGADCDDGDRAIYPGATETCLDGIDNDCDGEVDEDDDGVGAAEYCLDEDGDGFGGDGEIIESCAVMSGYAMSCDDCDDDNDEVHPGATEYCDEIDNNCDEAVDDLCGDYTSWEGIWSLEYAAHGSPLGDRDCVLVWDSSGTAISGCTGCEFAFEVELVLDEDSSTDDGTCEAAGLAEDMSLKLGYAEYSGRGYLMYGYEGWWSRSVRAYFDGSTGSFTFSDGPLDRYERRYRGYYTRYSYGDFVVE